MRLSGRPDNSVRRRRLIPRMRLQVGKRRRSRSSAPRPPDHGTLSPAPPKITGGPGRDVVNAGNGDDIIVATVGDGTSDVYNGGAGSDTIDMSAITVTATINLAQSTTSSSQTGQDTLSSIENAIGDAWAVT